MKQETETTSIGMQQSSLLATATKDELIVSQVLLDLRVMCSLLGSLSNFNWAHRRRRSALDAPAPLSPAPSPVRLVDVQVEADVARLQVKGGGDEATTASPDTPLDFPTPSAESDDKQQPNHSNKKTSREMKKYVDTIKELTHCRDKLRGEVENAKQDYMKLKAYDSELKARRQKVLDSCTSGEGQSYLEISRGGVNRAVELSQHYQTTTTVAHPQPLIGGDQMPQSHRYSFGGQIATQVQSSDHGLGSANHVGPLVIDLNIPAEEALGLLDAGRALAEERAICAEARRVRKANIKSMRRRRSAFGTNKLSRIR